MLELSSTAHTEIPVSPSPALGQSCLGLRLCRNIRTIAQDLGTALALLHDAGQGHRGRLLWTSSKVTARAHRGSIRGEKELLQESRVALLHSRAGQGAADCV